MINTYNAKEIISSYQPIDEVKVEENWNAVRSTFTHKIVVLDDDPTGVQTVHGVSVYTDWNEETLEQGFREKGQIFFILTNSRALTSKETEQVHRDIAQRVEKISTQLGKPYLIISRGDSTLRGHYPLETEVLFRTIEENSDEKVDGEVILPFFKEGGRLTIENTHYVLQEDVLVPAGKTEFANDRTFGYTSSHLGEWIEEKTKGDYSKDCVTYISLKTIRRLDYGQILDQLLQVNQFDKVVVNAVEEADVRIFATALILAIQKGKRFIFRTAAAFTKVIGDISSRPLLTREELISEEQQQGGLVIVGSHVQKTTDQLNELKTVASFHFIEFDAQLVIDKEAFKQEVNRVRLEAERKIKAGVTTVIYTTRKQLKLGEGQEEQELQLSVEISNAITSIVRNFSIRPNYLIAKGGITSSDIGTKGLSVKQATVAGQIAPGIPVWKTGQESLFPNMPYVIFPGNVGRMTTLKDVVLKLERK